MHDEYLSSWLLNIPELFSSRAPGMTCMGAIEHGATGLPQNPIKNSKGCGGVMRVAPIGLYFCDKPDSYEKTDMLGAEAAQLTHGHDLGYIPAAALAHIIRKVIEDDQITLKGAMQDSILAMNELFPDAAHIRDFVALMQKAVMLAASNTEDLDAIHELGEGWVAEETLAIAVFCALRHEHDFGRAVIAAVNHNGDSDSTGAVAGNILGAYLGYDAIPERFRQNLELHDVIVEIADDLLEGQKPEDAAWRKKYIEHDYRR